MKRLIMNVLAGISWLERGIVALYLKENEVTDLIIQVNGEYTYTSIEVGYEKQNYENINGRCETNGTFSYTTDNDVFFVALMENSDNYIEHSGIVIEDKEMGLKMFKATLIRIS